MPPYFPFSVVRMLFAATCLIVGAVFVQIYLFTVPAIERSAANVAGEEIDELEAAYATGGVDRLKAELAGRMGSGDGLYALAGSDEEMLFGNLKEWPWGADLSGKWRGRKQFRLDDGSVVHAGYRATVLSGGPILLVGREMSARAEAGAIIRRSFFYALAIIFAGSIFSAWYFHAAFNKRMRAISDAAEDIMRGDFSRRVPPAENDDEFASLGVSINMMLERIEGMMDSTRMVTDSITHHVRGALTRVRGHVERVADNTSEEAVREGIKEPARELTELLRIVDGLIEIARADAGLSRDQMKPVVISGLIKDLVDIYEPLAEECGIALSAQIMGEWSVVAHEALLAQALSNLIENALKYIEGGEIVIRAAAGPLRPFISIADNGPGIPADQRSQAIARFSRLGGSTKKDGVGLGLSIVAAIARLHQAEFLLEDNEPGLKATLRFQPKPVRPAFSRWRRWTLKRTGGDG